ncbi:hypothetical protein [Staphylococcus epidermidis]|nr:hypothetical protein [Staphylococcus epidermidis]
MELKRGGGILKVELKIGLLNVEVDEEKEVYQGKGDEVKKLEEGKNLEH